METVMRRALVLAIVAMLPLAAYAQDQGNASGSRREKFAEKFKAADANGDGKLSKEEMSQGFPRLAGHFDEIDADHDGEVTPAELRSFFQSMRGKRRGGGGASSGGG